MGFLQWPAGDDFGASISQIMPYASNEWKGFSGRRGHFTLAILVPDQAAIGDRPGVNHRARSPVKLTQCRAISGRSFAVNLATRYFNSHNV